MQKLGMAVDVEARTHDIAGLVSAIVKFYAKERGSGRG
jgi:hypothetical protein